MTIFTDVVSGKGGAGKTTIATNFALALADAGYKVGLVDIDIGMPDTPIMFGIDRVGLETTKDGSKLIPYKVDNIYLMSIGLDADKDRYIAWCGERIRRVVREFILGVEWEEPDFIIIDMPPGTSDEYIEVSERIEAIYENFYTIVVVEPTRVGVADARRLLNLLKEQYIIVDKNGLERVIAIIENDSRNSGSSVVEELAQEFGISNILKLKYSKKILNDLEQGKNTYLRKHEIMKTLVEWSKSLLEANKKNIGDDNE